MHEALSNFCLPARREGVSDMNDQTARTNDEKNAKRVFRPLVRSV